MERYITSSNGSVVGKVSNVNDFYSNNNGEAKWRLLQSYSNQRKNAYLTKHETSNERLTADTTFPNIVKFITKLLEFQFAPPSDNLWSIEIREQNNEADASANLESLYNNIISVNEHWKDSIAGTRWKINLEEPQHTHQYNGNNFVKEFTENSGVFLAQSINFTPMSTNIIDNPWAAASNNKMFFNFGNIATGRSESKSLKISFLISNWDIGDILFDPWIAAVAQQGLIENAGVNNGYHNIKAKIILSEYSSSSPMFNDSQPNRAMVCRKQYVFNDCVPVSRGEVSKTYDFSSAGSFKTTLVDFRYEDYEIHYKY